MVVKDVDKEEVKVLKGSFIQPAQGQTDEAHPLPLQDHIVKRIT